jgi:hypothetical protein
MIPESVELPAPNERVEFAAGADGGEYTIIGDSERVWLIVGVHGTGLPFAGELRLEEDGYRLQEVKPDVAVRFAGESDWRARLSALLDSELAGERQWLPHPDQ